MGDALFPQYALVPFQAPGRSDLGNRQDGVAEQSWMMELRRGPILDFINQFNWSPDDINYHKAIRLFLTSMYCEAERTLYALIFLCVLQPHRTIVAAGSSTKDMDEKLQAQGLSAQLAALGPLEHYEMQLEIFTYLARVAENPALLLSDGSVFTTPSFQQ